MKEFLKRQRMRIFWRYHRLRSWWPVWFYILNRQARRQWRVLGIALGQCELKIAQHLSRDGIAVLSINDLFPKEFSAGLTAELEMRLKLMSGSAGTGPLPAEPALIRSGLFSAGTKKYRKGFLIDLWGEGTAPRLNLANPFVRLALNDRILGIAGAYFGFCPKFHGFSLMSTVVGRPGGDSQYSQRWHRDPEDRKMVKAFLYLTDVEEPGAGPFSYVRGSHRSGRWAGLFPQHPPVGRYPPEGAVERAVPAGDIVICLGKAGTLIFCDTSGLHRGGFSTTRERVMFTAGYVSCACPYSRRYRRPDQAALAALPPLARYAVGPL